MSRFSSISGCLLAGAFGDSYGAAYEGQPNPEVGVYDPRTASPTDDTQLTLATCEAIVDCGGHVAPQQIAARFVSWFRENRLSGLGASTAKSLKDLDAGSHWALAGRGGEYAAGNGAAMRAAPLAFVLDPFEHRSRTVIRDVSRITHRSEEAYVGALAVVMAVHLALSGGLDGKACGMIASNLPDSVTRDRLSELHRRNPPSIGAAAAYTGVSGFTGDSVPLAVYSSPGFTACNFIDRMRELIACGGDTDTIASMAGQITGARLGLSELPELVDSVPEADTILSMARRLDELSGLP